MCLQNQSFEEFRDQCVNDLMLLQPEFMKFYDIDSYEEWFYDNGIGAFHFQSVNGKNLYFKYAKVGSFSTKTNTWRWSWDNTTTAKQISRIILKVKSVGSDNKFDPLTKGLFEGDEYTGWEMTAISANILNAIGSYRVPHDHLFVYFIFTDELTQEQYDKLKDNYVECENHTGDRAAFVCQHLLDNSSAGFHEAFDSNPEIEQEDDHQAWCDLCEKIRLKDGEWTDAAMVFANIKVVCDQCYFDIKERTLKV